MKEQDKLTTHQQALEPVKKAWVKPDFEVIDGDDIQSGKGSPGHEGVKSFFATYHS